MFPGSTLANPDIAESLRKAGAHVEVIPIYETKIAHVAKKTIDDFKTRIKQQEIHWITFTSSSTVNNFIELIGSDFITEHKGKLPIASIGPVTTKTLEHYDLHPCITAHEHTFEGLVNSIIRKEEHDD
jgi:uroporphyrinogen III methyltransferase/synthase